MKGNITWGKLEATFTLDQLDIISAGAAGALITMAGLLIKFLVSI